MTALAPQPPRRHSLSVTIIVYNEADRIEPCLESVAGWADEIIVLDSGSTVGDLDGDLIHLSFRDYHHAASKHLDYAWLLAQDKLAQGRRASLWYASARFLFDFFVQYIVRLSFLDGGRGFIVSVLLGRYAFDKYAALWTFKATGTSPKVEHDPSLRKRRPETGEKPEDP